MPLNGPELRMVAGVLLGTSARAAPLCMSADLYTGLNITIGVPGQQYNVLNAAGRRFSAYHWRMR